MTMLQKPVATLTGLGIGASLMYYLDPARGRRRRAFVKDKLTHAAKVSADSIGATGRDLAHRASGAVARVRGIRRNGPVDDVVLVERVRAQLGRLVSHPHAIDVDATAGRVRLRGQIPPAEQKRLLDAVHRVRGVRDIVYSLDERRDARHVEDMRGSGVYPASGPLPPGKAVVRTPAELGHPEVRRHLRGTGAADASRVLMVAGGLGLLTAAWRRWM
jgi:hypothetical protein